MGTFLDKILVEKRAAVAAAKHATPLGRIRELAQQQRDPSLHRRDFAAALSRQGLGVIAELKQASPSRGLLCSNYRPAEIAEGYEKAGAIALSVLTEQQFFLGSLDHLDAVRQATKLPVLRKDFIVDEYQVHESVAAGADALLLIVAALEDKNLCSLIELSKGLQIAALVEVHNEVEVDRAMGAGAHIIGVNNRDLRTFEVDLETSLRLRARIPRGCVTVSESGIGTAADLERLRDAGFDAVLIGERLITQPDPGKALAELLGRPGSRAGIQELEVRSWESEGGSQK
ncbi:MAG TPA: indole-3-glycerol phosphate synthase TrpC [Terriglobia bacterium]|nr:indole-3-glycerol phosphate synthase TrpC [Terriglobia bacterium]